MEFSAPLICMQKGLVWGQIKESDNCTLTAKIERIYQLSGAGGTHSLPGMPHHLEHLTAHLIQNGQQCLEKG